MPRPCEFYRIIGTVIQLEHAYDPRQLWLPFVDALIRAQCPEQTPPLTLDRAAVHLLASKKFASLPRTDPARKLYHIECGVEQIALPFIEGKCVSDAEWTELVQAGYPGWEKTSSHYVARLSVPQTAEARDWLMDNCRGRFRHKSKSARFEFLSDYAMASLRFR